MILPMALTMAFLAADVKPDVQWYRVMLGDKDGGWHLVGYQKAEFVAEGASFRYVESTLVNIADVRQDQVGDYAFGADLAPVSLDRVTKLGDVGEQVSRTVKGRVSDGKLYVSDSQKSSGETELAMPAGLISQGTVLFLYGGLEEGKAREFCTYSPRSMRVAKGTATRKGEVEAKDGEEDVKAWRIEETTDEAATLAITVAYLPPGEGRPNGRVLWREMKDASTDRKKWTPPMRYEACPADEGEGWVEDH